MSGNNFIKVNVNVGGKMQEILMEKGTSFSNNGGEYCVFGNGTLKFKPTNGSAWQDAKQIEMKDYQWQVFQNVVDNDGDANTYSQEDISEAMYKYRNNEFTEDIKQGLPEGFKISKQKYPYDADYVQADVRASENVGATLQFRIRGYMHDDVAAAKLLASYKPVTIVIPDITDEAGNPIVHKGNGTVTTKDGLTTTTIYGNDSFTADQVQQSVTKDSNGRIVSKYQLEYIGHGEDCATLTNYTYDAAGRVTSKSVYEGDPEYMLGDGTKVDHYGENYAPQVETWVYDDKGNLLKYKSNSDWRFEFEGTKEYTYHDNDVLATEKFVDEDGNIKETHYDSQGREILSKSMEKDGYVINEKQTIYEENGNITTIENGKSVTRDSRGNVIKEDMGDKTITRTFDANDNLTRKEEVRFHGYDDDRVSFTSVTDMKYDSKNRLIQKTKTYEGNVESVLTNEYNPDGSFKSQVIKNGNGEVTYKAENGQLIQRTDNDGYTYEYKDGVCVSSTLATALKDEISGIPFADPKREKLMDLCGDAFYGDKLVSVLTSYSAISPDETLEDALSSEWIFKYYSLTEGNNVNSVLMEELKSRIERLNLKISTEGKTPTQIALEIAQADSKALVEETF